MYADDIILITASVTHMRELIKICDSGLCEIDLQINIVKSTWIRVGCQFQCDCVKIGLGGEFVQVSMEAKFLGSVLVADSKFSISLSKNKIKFFCNANRILSKIGNSNLPVLMHLIDAYCVSALLYNLETFDLKKSQVNSLLFAINRLYMKICKTGAISNIQYMQFAFGKLPIDILLPVRKAKYLHILMHKNDIISEVFRDVIEAEIAANVKDWRTRGQNLKFPCKSKGWIIFSNIVNAL